MALTDKLTNIAEAIRNKTGKTDLMTLAQMPEEIASISGEELINHADIPDYVKKEVLSLAHKIEQLKRDDSIMFIAMSDMHYYGDQQYTDTWADANGLQTNISDLHGAMAAKILAYLYNFDFMTYLGDHVWGSKTTSLDTLKSQANDVISFLHESHKGIPCFHAIGNHDTGLYYDEYWEENGDSSNFMPSGEWLFNTFTNLSASDNTTFGNSTYGGYCYRDFEDKKLRVYLLNTSESILYNELHPTTKISSSCTGAQRKWFAESLNELNAKNDANEWGFIILSHYPADFGPATMPLSELIKAYVEGSSISIELEDSGGLIFNTTFSKNRARMIAQFHGHVHNFLTSKLHSYASGKATQYDAWRMAIPNCQFNRENYYTTVGAYTDISFKDNTTYTKTENSAKDTSFVVNIINPSEETVYSLCYGAGKDRVIGYQQVNFYSIENILDHITSSNSSIAVQEGSEYIAILTPEDLYKIKTITIMMGENDITSQVYNTETREINIPNVTGNITINASAIRPLASKNQIIYSVDASDNLYNPPYGYIQGIYISSSGAETSRTASYSTGYMPYTLGQRVKLSNVGLVYGSSSQSYNRITWFDSSKNILGQTNCGNTWILETQGTGIRNEKNEWTEFTLVKGAQNTLTEDVAFIRISGEYFAPDSIITFDEDIVYEDEVADGFTITNNLTNAITSNTTTYINYGDSYISTITLIANSDLTSISIVMGTTDITSKVYNTDTGKINIPRVTGNLTITVHAVLINYTNLVPTATVPPAADKSPRGTEIYNAPYGYMNNKRISGMSIVDGTGYVATGVIEWKALGAFNTVKPIYIRGVTLDTSKSYTRFELIQDNSGVGNTLQAAVEIRDDKTGRTWADYFNIETLGTNYYKLTPKEVSGVSWYNIRYFMLSLWGNGDNLIITVGEPIG